MPHHIYDVFGWLYEQSFTIQNALIIEFFDEQGVYIELFNLGSFMFAINNSHEDNGYLTRKEATIQAIKQANDIYNERFK